MLRSCCVLAFSLAACTHSPSTSSTPAPPPPITPVEVVIPELVEATRGEGLVPYIDHLYALGWSADGARFAYAIERADEACGCLTVDFAIDDTRGGTTWWSDHYFSDELGHDPTEATTFDELWARGGADWTAALRARAITVAPTATLTPVPIGGATFPRFEITTTAVGDDSEVGFAHLTSYDVNLSYGGEPYPVASHPDDGTFGPLEVTVPGMVTAPDNNHAVAIILETWRGWEGQQSVETLRVAPATR